MRPQLALEHARTLATQLVHVQRLLDGADIELYVPTLMVQVGQRLFAVDRRVAQRSTASPSQYSKYGFSPANRA